MTNDEMQAIYAAWAPDESPWSVWTKPVIFTYLTPSTVTPPAPWDDAGLQALKPTDRGIVVDLPGEESIACGIALARRGFRPIPLYNSTIGEGIEVLDLTPILNGLRWGANVLRELRLHPSAPPAFLLDSQRLKGNPGPRMFDNRWMVFPQDLPSARMLRASGVQSMTVVHRSEASGGSAVESDLRGILRLWQREGIELRTLHAPTGAEQDLTLRLSVGPFLLEHFARVMHQLRSNSSGGFGAQVPDPAESTGG